MSPNPTRKGWSSTGRSLRNDRKYGIEPLVTIAHFDIPIGLIKKHGGWKSRAVIEEYKKFVTVLFTEFKGLVHYWDHLQRDQHDPAPALHGQRAWCSTRGNDPIQSTYLSAHHELVAQRRGHPDRP